MPNSRVVRSNDRHFCFLILVNPKVTHSSSSVISAEIDIELASLAEYCEKTYAFSLALMQELLTGRTRLI